MATTDITNRIIERINIIKGKETSNKKFVSDINNQVVDLKNIVDELLKKLDNYIFSLNGKITQFQSNQKQIEQLIKEKDELRGLLNELKNQISYGTEAENTSAQQNKNLSDQINSLTQKEQNLQQQIDQLRNENMALKEQLNKMNIDLESIEKALNDLDSTLITQDELQQVLTIIGQIKSAIADFTKDKSYLTGGRQRRSRKFVTRKMKRRVMKGGYIADYKLKTLRRRKDKKRSSSMRRGKKQRYTTSSSRLTTTSSY